MRNPCIYDRDEECLENCPECTEFKQKCFRCGEQFEQDDKKISYAFPKRGIQDICPDCLFELEKKNHYKDFCEENEDLYKQYIIMQYSD